MSRNLYCNPLNFPCKIITNEMLLSSLKTRYINYVPAKIFLTTEFLQILDSKGCKVLHLESFYSQEHYVQPIHIDSLVNKRQETKINFVWGGENSIMNWYEIIDDSIEPVLELTPIGTPYQIYPASNHKLVHSEAIHSPSLVNTSVPHNIVNFSEKRLCLSLLVVKKDNNYMPYKEALEVFSEYLI